MSRDQRLPCVRMGRWVLTVMPIDIDSLTSPGLVGDLTCLVDHQDGAVLVVDMTQTGFCDSSGVRMLIRVHQHATGRGSEVRFVIPPSAVRRILGLTGADQILPIFTTMNEALTGAPTGIHTTDGEHGQTGN